jgi:hypothetical protein
MYQRPPARVVYASADLQYKASVEGWIAFNEANSQGPVTFKKSQDTQMYGCPDFVH